MKKKGTTPTNEPGIVLEADMNPDATKASTSASLKINKPEKTKKNVRVDGGTNSDVVFEAPVEPAAVGVVLDEGSDDDAIEFVVEDDFDAQNEVMANASKELSSKGTELQTVADSNAGGGEKGRIGDMLIAQGVITEAQLNVAIQEKKISGKMIGEVLVDLGFIDDDELSVYLAQASGFDIFDPKNTIMDGEVLAYVAKDVATKYQMLPFSRDGDEFLVAMSDPYDVVALDILRQNFPKKVKVKPCVATKQVILSAIDAAYGFSSDINAILKELEKEEGEVDLAQLQDEAGYSHPIVRLVNSLIFEAVKTGASDLHFEPEENFVRLRYRLDGVLFNAQILHKQHWSGISQRIKIMSSLNIADKLSPQDGRIQMNVGGHEVDFRVSSLPTVHGENIVMRVLDKQSSILPLNVLGFSEVNKGRIDRAQKRPEGIIIVTGPTGSGKTTTLYSMLNEINTVDVNIQTLEDPVEYSLPMIRQTSVREGVLSFADGIRALLRQDPDIIFIGEVRDKTTAEMALQAAMTGHQVYTSLHTNDSFGALPRLYDLGMVPGMIAGNIISVFAQRLGRVLCPNCKEPYTATEDECKLLGVETSKSPEIFRAHQGGCDTCGGQGYKGRVALAEILLFDDEMDAIVAKGGTRAEIKEIALAKGFKSIKDDGMLKILEGKTTFDAVSKIVSIE